MILIFHQNHYPFLRQLPFQDLKKICIGVFFCLGMSFSSALYPNEMLYLSPNCSNSKATGLEHDPANDQLVDDCGIDIILKVSCTVLNCIACPSPLITLPHALPCCNLESRQHSTEPYLSLQTTTGFCNRHAIQCVGLFWFTPSTVYCNTTHRIMHVGSKLPRYATCPPRIHTINRDAY